MKSLLKYQGPALDYTQRIQNPLVAMEMRLGKAVVSIKACNLWKAKRILVIAPAGVLGSWMEELNDEGLSERTIYRGPGKEVVPVDSLFPKMGPTWELVNYERVLADFNAWSPEDFGAWQDSFDVVILDEITKIKNPSSKISKLLCASFRHAKHRMGLSGLPDPEGPQDFFQIFKFLNGSFMGHKNFWAWQLDYFTKMAYDWFPKPGTREAIKRMARALSFILDRHEAKVGGKKVFQIVRVAPNAEQIRLAETVRRDFEFGPNHETTKYITVVECWLGRIAGGHGAGWEMISDAKPRALVSLLQKALKGKQVVVFFRYNHEIHTVWKYLKAAKIPTTWITGETDVKDRDARRLAFRDGKYRVALLQIKCCKYGLNFATASAAIYYSNSCSLEERKQSEDRIITPLNRDPKLIIDLVTAGTVDEDIVELLRAKYSDAKFFLSDLLSRLKARLRQLAPATFVVYRRKTPKGATFIVYRKPGPGAEHRPSHLGRREARTRSG